MTMTTTTKTIDEIVEQAETEFRRMIDAGQIQNARRADEHAAELAGDIASTHGIEDHDSEDYEEILTALLKIAGEEFPGDW